MRMKSPPEVRLVHRDTLVYRIEAELAGVAERDIRPLQRSARVGRVHVADIWVETDLDDCWRAAYRIAAQSRGLAIAEVRVFPKEAGRRQLGEWSGKHLGLRAKVPGRGITSKLLRSVPVDRSVWYSRKALLELPQAMATVANSSVDVAGARRFVEGSLSRVGVSSGDLTRSRQRGRKPLPDAEYRRIAREYTKIAAGTAPGRLYDRLAKKLRLTVGQAINRVATARRLGLLATVPR